MISSPITSMLSRGQELQNPPEDHSGVLKRFWCSTGSGRLTTMPNDCNSATKPSPEFVETERGKRTNQRKTGGQRKEQRQHGIANDQSEQNKAENGINHAQDNGVSWDGLEVFPAQAQRVAQVGKVDLANDKGGRDAKQLQFGSCEYCGHSSGLLACDRRGTERTQNAHPPRARNPRSSRVRQTNFNEKELCRTTPVATGRLSLARWISRIRPPASRDPHSRTKPCYP